MPDDVSRRRSEVQESLLHLYLRLNGYFVTGFIVHSPIHGRNVAEVDALAVRHPYNDEPEREVGPSDFLEPLSGVTDLLICEVKSLGQPLQFNESLRRDPAAVATVLRWSGLFHGDEVIALARQLVSALAPDDLSTARIVSIPGPRDTRIRAVVCAPERRKQFDNQVKFIHGAEIFSYITRCLCPEMPREECSVRYDFTGWGQSLAPLVQFFKGRGTAAAQGTMPELYAALGC